LKLELETQAMNTLVDYLSRHYRRVVEVGIGTYTRVARALEKRGVVVVATDINPQPEGIPVVTDDIWQPRLDLYESAQALYAVRPPPELVPPLKDLARRLALDLIVKPLAGEPCDGRVVSGNRGFFYVYDFGTGGREDDPEECLL
jgi:uncharacterized UPF0146 family protein